MLTTFQATLSPMLVLFLCMVLGFIAKKARLVPDNTATVLSKLENYFLVPALILNTFMKYCTVRSVRSEYRLILYCLLVLAAALLIAFPLSHVFERKDEYRRNIYKYALTFGNFSFMGNAIVPAILGEAALYRYMLFILPLNVASYTWGLYTLIPKGEKKQSVFRSLLNPIFFALLIGAALGLTGLAESVPSFVTTAVGNCASCMGPMAMILTGFVVAGYDFVGLLKNWKIYIATFLRLLVLPAFFILLLRLIGADETALLMTLFAFGTPLGLNTVVFPAAYGGDTSTGASMAMISHTLCIVSIPFLYAIFRAVI